MSRWFPEASVQVLFEIGAYREVGTLIFDEDFRSVGVGIAIARAQFELGQFKEARETVLARASGVDLRKEPRLAFLKAMLDIIDGDEAAALTSISKACRTEFRFMRPRQISPRGLPRTICRTISTYFAGHPEKLMICTTSPASA